MKIYNENDVVISSRIRFARNIADYPFINKCDETSAKEIIEKIRKTLGESFKEIDFSSIDEIDAVSYVESHGVSRDFIKLKLPHSLFVDPDKKIKIMACEEDHIRLQVIYDGFTLDSAYNDACKIDDLLSLNLNIAYDETLGYLTQCPTNIGCAMRASVMMFLPALTMAGKINGLANQLSKIGLTMRGLYGEGTAAQGSLYQISNQITLGIT